MGRHPFLLRQAAETRHDRFPHYVGGDGLLDLTQAILIGFGVSTLIFMAQMSDLSISRQTVDADRLSAAGHTFVHPDHGIAVYYISGPLFFAASRKLAEEVEQLDAPADTLILSLRGVPLVDATGVEVLRELYHRQQAGGGYFAGGRPAARRNDAGPDRASG
ncbi:MAG: STAS domain-containing protein [Chloroflexota bacterium]